MGTLDGKIALAPRAPSGLGRSCQDLPKGGRVQRPGQAPGSRGRVAAPPGGRRQRRPTGAPPPLPKTIGLTGKLWLGAVLVVVVSGTVWLHFTTGPLDRLDAVLIRVVT